MAKVPPMPTLVWEPAFRECLMLVPPRVMEPRKSVAEVETEIESTKPSKLSGSVPLFTVTLSSTASVFPPRKVRATLPSMPMAAPALSSEPAAGAASPSDGVASGFASLAASRPAPDALLSWAVPPAAGGADSFWDSTLSSSRSRVFCPASPDPSSPCLDHLVHFSESVRESASSDSSSFSLETTLALASFLSIPVVVAEMSRSPVMMLPFALPPVLEPSFPVRVLPATSRASLESS